MDISEEADAPAPQCLTSREEQQLEIHTMSSPGLATCGIASSAAASFVRSTKTIKNSRIFERNLMLNKIILPKLV